MSYSISKALPIEIVYAYAMVQRYNSINKKHKNTLYSDRLKVALRQEDLDKYINTFVAFYQAKHHEDMYIFKTDQVLNFGAYNYMSQNKNDYTSILLNQMFEYDSKTNTLRTTHIFNPKFVEKNCLKVLTKEELNILNKQECTSISTQTLVHNTQEEIEKIKDYKTYFSNISLDKILQQQKDIQKNLKSNYVDLYLVAVTHNLLISTKNNLDFNVEKMTKDLEFLSERLPILAKCVNSIITYNDAMPYDQSPEGIVLKEYLIKSAKSKSDKIHSELRSIYREHKMDVNENEIERLSEELIALSPILNRVILTTKSINDNKLQLKAISDILPKQPMHKQIGDNTPPKKVIEKYNSLKKHQRILNKINDKQNVRPINPADIDAYKRATKCAKTQDKSKDGR